MSAQIEEAAVIDMPKSDLESVRGRSGRIVVLSNRMAPLEPGKAPKGGLAVGISGALLESGGVWMGWSGDIVDSESPTRIHEAGGVTFASVDLTEPDVRGYYNGFSNQTLWPAFHYRTDLIRYNHDQFKAYLRVNRLFAKRLADLLRPGDKIWVHDYHLIPVARFLREAGIDNTIGFFLHTPFPGSDILDAVPHCEELLDAFFHYDLVGFQIDQYVRNFIEACEQVFDCTADDEGHIVYGAKSIQVEAFPIGIDAERMIEFAERESRSIRFAKLLDSFLGAGIVLGIDRLDYSKGIPERLKAFDCLLRNHPEWHRKTTFLQISPPSRSSVADYQELRQEVEQLAGEINAHHNEPDWVAIRYVYRSFGRRQLAGYYRAAKIGCVTPLRDGMNLVAKEFVACQDRSDPGVLVLSKFAGAAAELDAAVIVNPHDVDSMARALHRALIMPLEERQERHRALLKPVVENTATDWCQAFIKCLSRLGGTCTGDEAVEIYVD